MYLGSWDIDDVLTFVANTHNPTTAAASDADALPSYRVYEDTTDTALLSGTLAKLDDTNTTGFYRQQITLSTANGFESGKTYTIYVSGTVAGTVGTGSHTFQIGAKVEAVTLPTKGEPAAGAPPATASVDAKIDWLYALARNKLTQTSTTLTLRNDADSANIATAAVSDSAGTFTRGEFS